MLLHLSNHWIHTVYPCILNIFELIMNICKDKIKDKITGTT